MPSDEDSSMDEDFFFGSGAKKRKAESSSDSSTSSSSDSDRDRKRDKKKKHKKDKKASKKEKKDKKERKERKKDKHRSKHERSAGSAAPVAHTNDAPLGDDGSDADVSGPPPPPPHAKAAPLLADAPVRDSWMTAPPKPREPSAAEVERARQAAEATAEVERAKSEAAAAQLREQRAREQALRERGADLPSHGDGGLQWRQRALKRAEEQAREAGVSLEEYAKERWGSLDALKSSISDSRTATRTPGQPAAASSAESSAPVSADREHADRRAQAAVAQRMKAPHADEAVSQSPVVASDWRTKLGSSRSEHEKLVSSSTSSHTSAAAQPALPQSVSAAGQGSADAVDVNKLMARALRAKLMGDMATFERLTAEAEAAKSTAVAPSAVRTAATGASEAPAEKQLQGHVPSSFGRGGAKAAAAQSDSDDEVEEEEATVVVLSALDERGRPRELPRAPNAAPQPAFKRARVGDEANISLRSMVEEERLHNSLDHRDAAIRAMTSGARAAELLTAKDTDEAFDAADSLMFERKDKVRHDPAKDEQRARQAAIHTDARVRAQLEKCWFCFASPVAQQQRHLSIALGDSCQLLLPRGRPLVPYHCLITTLDHATASTEWDDSAVAESARFKQALVQMFASMQHGCLFIETANERSRGRHAVIECIPLPRDQFLDAPIYFKKAILESDEEWAQHKKLIDTRGGKPIARAVPKGFAYFHVEFGLDGGFAHVIEDSVQFPADFGKGVICGLLEEPAEFMLRFKSQTRQEEWQRVQEFLQHYKRFDWTAKLAGGFF